MGAFSEAASARDCDRPHEAAVGALERRSLAGMTTRDVALTIALVAAFTGCRDRGPSNGAAPAAASSTAPMAAAPAGSSDGASAAAPLEGPCGALLVAEKLDGRSLAELNPDSAKNGIPRFVCRPSAGGAWAVRVDPPGGTGQRTSRTLLHIDKNGKEARAEGTYDHDAWPTLSWAGTTLPFDYDGDGEPELLLVMQTGGDAETPLERALYTFRDDKIARYAPAASFDIAPPVVDVDRDGRPDLQVSFSFGKRDSCGENTPVAFSFLAHSLKDGTFSLKDSVASGDARQACPKPPTKLRLRRRRYRQRGGRPLRTHLGEEPGERAQACRRDVQPTQAGDRDLPRSLPLLSVAHPDRELRAAADTPGSLNPGSWSRITNPCSPIWFRASSGSDGEGGRACSRSGWEMGSEARTASSLAPPPSSRGRRAPPPSPRPPQPGPCLVPAK